MSTSQHFTAQVLPGGRIEISTEGLVEGQTVDIVVVPRPASDTTQLKSLQELFDSFPPGPRGVATWEELDAHIQEERNAWDR
jgi:hypothetical protein